MMQVAQAATQSGGGQESIGIVYFSLAQIFFTEREKIVVKGPLGGQQNGTVFFQRCLRMLVEGG